MNDTRNMIFAAIILNCFFLANVMEIPEDFGHNEEKVDYDSPIIPNPSSISSRTPQRLRKRMTKVMVHQSYGKCKSSADLVLNRVVRSQNFEANMNCDKMFDRSGNNMEEFRLIGPNGIAVTALVKFKIFPLLRADKLMLRCFGKVVSGPLRGAKVSKLEVFDGDQLDTECSSEPGLIRTTLIDNEIIFETTNGKIECKADNKPGFMQFEPGLLYHRILGSMAKRLRPTI